MVAFFKSKIKEIAVGSASLNDRRERANEYEKKLPEIFGQLLELLKMII